MKASVNLARKRLRRLGNALRLVRKRHANAYARRAGGSVAFHRMRSVKVELRD